MPAITLAVFPSFSAARPVVPAQVQSGPALRLQGPSLRLKALQSLLRHTVTGIEFQGAPVVSDSRRVVTTTLVRQAPVEVGKREPWIDLDRAREIGNRQRILLRVEVHISSIVEGQWIIRIAPDRCLIFAQGKPRFASPGVNIGAVYMGCRQILWSAGTLLEIGAATSNLTLKIADLVAVVDGAGVRQRSCEQQSAAGRGDGAHL